MTATDQWIALGFADQVRQTENLAMLAEIFHAASSPHMMIAKTRASLNSFCCPGIR